MQNSTVRPAIESDAHRLVEEEDIVAGAVIEMVRRRDVLHGGFYPTTKIVVDIFPEYHVTNGVAHVPYHLLDSPDTHRRFVTRSSLLGLDDGGIKHINYWVPYGA